MKSVVFGVPVVMLTVLVAVLALWAWGPLGASGDGPSSNATLVWNVEYWHRNAAGEVLQHKKDHNTVTVEGIDRANALLIDSTQILANNSDATDNDTYDQILLMDVNLATRAITAAPQAADILLLVDGGTGNNTGQNTDGVNHNPADGAYAAGATDSGDGTVTVQFLAQSGDPPAALQMRLVKAIPDDTATTCCATITLADTLAVIAINVDLADTDTLTITWTLNLNVG